MSDMPLAHLIFTGIMALIPLTAFTLYGLSLIFPKSRWFCDKLGWHKDTTAAV